MNAAAILCENIRRIRLANDWSQELVAEKAGLGARHFQDIEAGRRDGLRLATVEKIAAALGVLPWELLQESRFPEPVRRRGKSGPAIER